MPRALFALIATMVVAAAVLPAQRREDGGGKSADDWCRESQFDSDRRVVCDVREETLGPLPRIDVDTGGNGGISVRGSDTREVRLRTRLMASGRTEEDARRVMSAIELTTAGGTIRAAGPVRSNGREWWSATMELEVPRSIDLALRTSNGGIQVSNVEGMADLRTSNGGIVMDDVDGDVRGRTTNGGVRVRLRGERWQGTGLTLTTTNGGVSFDVPDGYSADLEARTTNGGIRIDFPITVQGDMSRRHVNATLGSGGAPIKLTTTNGGINVTRR
jgi:DUF4097 and DUF4098 domain-containing protein YvlB